MYTCNADFKHFCLFVTFCVCYRCGQASEVDDTASRMKRQTTDTDNDEEFVYDPTFDPEVCGLN